MSATVLQEDLADRIFEHSDIYRRNAFCHICLLNDWKKDVKPAVGGASPCGTDDRMCFVPPTCDISEAYRLLSILRSDIQLRDDIEERLGQSPRRKYEVTDYQKECWSFSSARRRQVAGFRS